MGDKNIGLQALSAGDSIQTSKSSSLFSGDAGSSSVSQYSDRHFRLQKMQDEGNDAADAASQNGTKLKFFDPNMHLADKRPDVSSPTAANAIGNGGSMSFDLVDAATGFTSGAVWPPRGADDSIMLQSFQTLGAGAFTVGLNNNNSMISSPSGGANIGSMGSLGNGSVGVLPPFCGPSIGSGMPTNNFSQHRRAITAQHNFHMTQKGPMPAKMAWNGPSAAGPPAMWAGPQQPNISPWTAALQLQQQQRSTRPSAMGPAGGAGMLKKGPQQQQQQAMQGAGGMGAHMNQSRFRRGSPQVFTGRHNPMDLQYPGLMMPEQPDGGLLHFHDPRQNGNDSSMKFDVLQSQLLDIMRQNQIDAHDAAKMRSPYFVTDEHGLLGEELGGSGLDHGLPPFGMPLMSPMYGMHADRTERYSRKVFVGGLPPDIDEEEITSAFRRFGPLMVDWPHKAESKSYFPPKGYCFLLFQEELSVQSLIDACLHDDNKMYWCVTSPTMKDKPVQIRPWNLSDSDYVMDGSQPLDPRKTIFVGGVPRPLRAMELALIMDRLYGCVCYAGIDTDPELKYPKGAGRVAFSNQQSYIAAISARFVQLQHGEIDKRVEVKPYVLDDQMCDECQGMRCGGKFAPFFCANITCLQYYCEYCWSQIHSRPGREYHKPLVKEGADRPRAVPFRWC